MTRLNRPDKERDLDLFQISILRRKSMFMLRILKIKE